jgi:hypothetical protein
MEDNSAYEAGTGIQLLIYNKTVRNPKIKLWYQLLYQHITI